MDLQLEKKELMLAGFDEYLRARNRSPRTIENYLARAGYFLTWAGKEGMEELGQIDTATVRGYQQHLYADTKLTQGTQQGYLVALKILYRYFEKMGLVVHNPTTIIELPNLGVRLGARVLSAREITVLLNAADIDQKIGLRDRAMMEMFYSTGMRTNELLELRLEDVDFAENTVRIWQGKGNRERVVPLGEIAKGYAQEYVRGYRSNVAVQGNYFFLSLRGRRLSHNQVSRMFRKYRRRTGVKGKTGAHRLRHACATHMLHKGAPLRCIQELLGHASLDTTQIYTRVEISDLQRVHRKTHPREQV